MSEQRISAPVNDVAERIAKPTKAERERLKEQLKQRLQDYVNTITQPDRRAGKGLYHCPLCGSGQGKDGAFSMNPDGVHWKCFACEKGGDLFDLIGYQEHIEGLPARIDYAANLFGTLVTAPYTHKEKNPYPYATQKADYSQYLNKCYENVGGTSYWASRGFTQATMQRFKLGFDKEKDAVVIPYSQNYYISRSIQGKSFYKPKASEAGQEPIFNQGALYSGKPAFVCESPIDAMSICQAGGNAVSLGGVGHRKLLAACKDKQPVNTLILCFDHDDAGKAASAKLCDELQYMGIPCIVADFDLSQYPKAHQKDANDLLIANVQQLETDVARITEAAEAAFRERENDNLLAKAEQNKQAALAMLAKLKELHPKHDFEANDKGLSEVFSQLTETNLRYNPTAKSWMAYESGIWKTDVGGMRAAKAAKIFVDTMIRYAAERLHDETQANFLKQILKYKQQRNRQALLEDAKSCRFIEQGDFDKDGNLLNCQNGTYNLASYTFTPHDPLQMLTKKANIIYDENARSDLWESFVSQIMLDDTDKIEYLQKIMGYALTTDTSLEKFWFLYGATTRNGKSTFIETLLYMLGENYASTMQTSTLAAKKIDDAAKPSSDIARLDGCRLLNASEPPKRMLFNTNLAKVLTGRDSITARRLYENEKTFIPQFKLFINTNYLPITTDDSLFSSGRVLVIPFERHFSEDEQDLTLKARLKEPNEISGIFNWCVEGLKKFRATEAKPPESIRAATDAYRQMSDKIGTFISECLQKSIGQNTSAKSAYFRYCEWCDSCGYSAESKGNFISDMKAKGMITASGYVDGRTTHNVILNYRIVEDFEGSDDDFPIRQ